MRQSESHFLDVRGLRYHVRRWPAASGAPKLFLLHGWMDVSASFQFMVDQLEAEWDVYAPDWRGYGLSEWGPSDCYWFPDYLADLDFLLDALQPGQPACLVGHSLGGNVACLYAGIRPERVARLVNLEGFGLPASPADQAPGRYRAWLDELHEKPQLRPYADFDALARRLRGNNRRLTAESAAFLAAHWGKQQPDGTVTLRGDPAHKIVNPLLYRYEEVRACWRHVSAPVLWVEAENSDTLQRMKMDAAEQAERRSAFAGLRHATVRNAGHMLHHDQPRAVARLIEDFLRS